MTKRKQAGKAPSRRRVLPPELVDTMNTMQALADDLYQRLTEVQNRSKARAAAPAEVAGK